MESKEKLAKRLLVHYIRMLMEASGLGWTGDNEAEIELIVDAIIEASITP